jgi:sRNA-binding protein
VTAVPTTPSKGAQIAAVVIELLAEQFPKCFAIYERRRRPLRIGIYNELLAALDGAVTGCGEAKTSTEFYKQSKAGNGLMHVCKACHRLQMKMRRLTDPDVQRRDRERAKTPKRREHSRNNVGRWRRDNPAGYRAHNAANNAVRDGKLHRQPCEVCGANEALHKHHRDYSKPLDVIWLCARCHHRLHALFPELQAQQNKNR